MKPAVERRYVESEVAHKKICDQQYQHSNDNDHNYFLPA